ncbi:hypothetical protein VTK56DRAFT_9128 [Thermocarpiscus australiensis]
MLETHPLTPGLKLARTESRARTTPTAVILPTTVTVRATTLSTTCSTESQPSSEGDQRSSATLLTDTATLNPYETIGLIFETAYPTSSFGPSDTASSDASGKGGIGSLDRGTSIVVIVVVTVVAGVAFWTAAFLLVRRYKQKRLRSREKGIETGFGSARPDGKESSGASNSIIQGTGTPNDIPELDSATPVTPAIGSTPNPAELEGDMAAHSLSRPWMRQKSWLKSPSILPPQHSPRSVQSPRLMRRTVRESFGEKVNDPAAVLGRLRIPNPLSPMSRSSPKSASPRTGGFWRLPRSPKSQLPKPSPRSGLGGNSSKPSMPTREQQGAEEKSDGASAMRPGDTTCSSNVRH